MDTCMPSPVPCHVQPGEPDVSLIIISNVDAVMASALLQVVPFSPTAGLLQWVDDTMPLVEYLTGHDRMGGAHLRYARPGDMSFLACHQAISKAKRHELRQTYDKVRGEADIRPCDTASCSWPGTPKPFPLCVRWSVPCLGARACCML